MANPKGNPVFGKNNPHRFNFGREEPLPEQVKAQVRLEVKLSLKNLAEEKKCTVPDLVREALDQYLSAAATK